MESLAHAVQYVADVSHLRQFVSHGLHVWVTVFSYLPSGHCS